MLSTLHLRELTAAASRVFGWGENTKQGDTYSTLVITSEQLDQIRKLRAETTEGEREEISSKLRTPKGQNGLREIGRELASAQNMEQPELPPTPPGPAIYELKIRGDGGGVKTKP